MGSKGMNKELSQYLKTNYKDSKSDMFSVFLDYFLEWIKENGFLSIITMQSWMFLSSYEKLRIKIFNNSSIDSMIHLGTRAFEEIDGEVVQTTSFVIKKVKIINYKANFIRLVDFNNAEEKRIKTMEAIQNPDVDYRYKSYTKDFNKIPGSPIAYWVSDKVREIFQNNKSLGEIASPRQGLATADNKRFLRHWHEVDFKNIGFDFKNREEAKESDLKWFPYQKGGDFRKWYGNNEYLINWKNDGREIKNYEKSVIRNLTYYFKKGITWSAISSSTISMRINNDGFVFDSKGPKLFSKENYDYILGLNNNIISNNFLKILSPTLDFNQGCISKIPFIKPSNQNILNKIDSLVEENIEISKKDWDSFEISWDFQKHPLLLIDELTNSNKSSLIKTQFKKWEEFTQKQFSKLKENEEELNKIFINIYGLNEEMSPNIDGKDITISKADKTQEIKSFLSYAVGCMVGRYSLDIPGLVYAGGEYDPEKYKTYEADDDNIIPVLEDEYFDDDIVVRFKKFVKKVFGEETLNENLLYIAETLGKKSNETPLQTIRKYFTKEFYKDHVQIYKKKPIYWMFNSGKNNGFKVLIYMHRYEPKILAVMRTKYLHALQGIYERRRKELDKIIQIETNERNKTKAKREMNEIDKKIKECIEYDKVLKDVADHGIEIDLDGGVDVNYEKFQNKDIGEGKKKNLLTKK
jgi:type II restriction/modification system DNA methylase subunit YeeA